MSLLALFFLLEYPHRLNFPLEWPHWLNRVCWNVPTGWMFCTGISSLAESSVLECPHRLNVLHWNSPTDWIFHAGISSLTEYFALAHPWWLNICKWNILTDWIFYTGKSVSCWDIPADWVFCTGMSSRTEHLVQLYYLLFDQDQYEAGTAEDFTAEGGWIIYTHLLYFPLSLPQPQPRRLHHTHCPHSPLLPFHHHCRRRSYHICTFVITSRRWPPPQSPIITTSMITAATMPSPRFPRHHHHHHEPNIDGAPSIHVMSLLPLNTFLLTEYFALEYPCWRNILYWSCPHWRNILYWNILTDRALCAGIVLTDEIFCTGTSFLSQYIVLCPHRPNILYWNVFADWIFWFYTGTSSLTECCALEWSLLARFVLEYTHNKQPFTSDILWKKKLASGLLGSYIGGSKRRRAPQWRWSLSNTWVTWPTTNATVLEYPYWLNNLY